MTALHAPEKIGRKYSSFEDYKDFYQKLDHVTLTDAQLLTAPSWFDRARKVKGSIMKFGRGSVLDIGCHTGINSLFLARLGFKVVGLDLHPKAIEEADQFCKRNGIKDAEWYCSAFEEWKDDRKFDYVIIAEIIEHVLDPVALLEFAEKHANKLVIVSTPEYHGQFGICTTHADNQHIRCYHGNELRDLLSTRGEIVDCIIDDIIHIAYKPR